MNKIGPGIAAANPSEGETFFFEEVELDGDLDIDTSAFNEVPDDLSNDSDGSEDLLRKAIAAVKSGRQTESIAPGEQPDVPVIDDFFRNFLLQNHFHATLKTFQTEYYERVQKDSTYRMNIGSIPDVYKQHELLGRQIEQLNRDLQNSKDQTRFVKLEWEKLRKERDFHRLHHRRVVQEKHKLATDMKRLRKHYSSYEPTIKMLKEKYENTMKEKMMMKIEKDRLLSQMEALQQQLKSLDEGIPNQRNAQSTRGSKKPYVSTNQKTDTPFPPDRSFAYPLPSHVDPINVDKFTLQKSFKGHSMAVADIAHHPTKPIVATVSDDRTWKLWSIPNGELIMSGEGHRDWVGSCDFHPEGNLLATASGDGTVKIWDLVDATVRTTFIDHSQPVWSCNFHSLGDFIVSGSTDTSAKVWDLRSERCRHTFRGHVDSINCVVFQPNSNCFATASGDKTVSLWDLRSGLCVQTFFGHMSAVNHVSFNAGGDQIASSDTDGIVKLWDIRAVCQIFDIQPNVTGTSTNRTFFDPSGSMLISAGNDCTIRVRNAKTGEELGVLAGHEDSVQSICTDAMGKLLLSAGSDCSFRIWS